MATSPTATMPEPGELLYCYTCRNPITDMLVRISDRAIHSKCFICHQCLRPLDNDLYIQVDHHVYCEEDFLTMFGERCARCAEIIRGKYITALDATWHEEHFTCECCGKQLGGTSFMKKGNRPYCKNCYSTIKAKEVQKQVDLCEQCKKPIREGLVVIKKQKFHISHFNCVTCSKTLTPDYKEVDGKLYCQDDYKRLQSGFPTCHACRGGITGALVTAANGKQFHPEHFACSKCAKPFSGDIYWEINDRILCEYHYNEEKGTLCSYCYEPARGKAKKVFQKMWCEDHCRCFGCYDLVLNNKFEEWDGKLLCPRCWETLPSSTRKNMNKYA